VAVSATNEDSAATGVNGDQLNNAALSSGAVYVFTRSGTSWSQQAYVKASNTGQSDDFGFALTLSGNTLVVGADLEDSAALGVNGNQLSNDAANAGAVYVFTRSGSTWTQQAYLKASNTEADDQFGSAGRDVGADPGGGRGQGGQQGHRLQRHPDRQHHAESGAVYILERSGSTWTQQGYLKASNTGQGDGFGFAVALSGNTLVVGAQGEDSNATGINGANNNNATSSGASYVFTRSGILWVQQAYVKASNTDSQDLFGWAVAVDGESLLVAAQNEASNATGIGGNQNNNRRAARGRRVRLRPRPRRLDRPGPRIGRLERRADARRHRHAHRGLQQPVRAEPSEALRDGLARRRPDADQRALQGRHDGAAALPGDRVRHERVGPR
jgi:hypothetical protein